MLKNLQVVYQLDGDWHKRTIESVEFPWLSEDQKLIADELRNQTDRGMAIIAGSYIDDLLSVCLKSRLNISHKTIENRIFGRQGSLNAFGSKIDMGLALNLYKEIEWDELHKIRNIRNEFAHISAPRNFETQRIHDLCFNLRAWDFAINQFIPIIGEERAKKIRDQVDSPRKRFLLSSIHFFSFLWLLANHGVKKA